MIVDLTDHVLAAQVYATMPLPAAAAAAGASARVDGRTSS